MIRALLRRLLMLPRIRFEGACRRCGTCCRNLVLLDNGTVVSSESQFRRLLKRKPDYACFEPLGCTDSDGWMYFSCSRLGPDNLCRDYDRRPDICRRYPNAGMIRRGGKLLDGCGYRIKRSETV